MLKSYNGFKPQKVMKNNHPRFINYKQHEAYYKMYPMYRPYIYWINEPLYKSPYVNTDSLGLRINYAPNGSVIEIKKLKSEFKQCDIIVGGSTVFGVDASSDKKTISYFLSGNDVPCINLGNRGATSYQELLLFIFLQPYLPSIRNIYLLSGVNDCSLASMEASVIYDEFSGLFGQDYYMTYPYMSHLAACYDDFSYSRLRLYNSIERRYRDNKVVRFFIKTLLKNLFKKEQLNNALIDKRKSFEAKIGLNLANLENQLHTWAGFAKVHKANLYYFLQPCMFWNNKQLSPIEQQCFDADSKIYPSMLDYANSNFHQKYSSAIKAIAQNAGIFYNDTNLALNEIGSDVEVFTDVCHLTDAGNELIAKLILKYTQQ